MGYNQIYIEIVCIDAMEGARQDVTPEHLGSGQRNPKTPHGRRRHRASSDPSVNIQFLGIFALKTPT